MVRGDFAEMPIMPTELPETLRPRPRPAPAPQPEAKETSKLGGRVVNGVILALLLSKVVGLGLTAASHAHAAQSAPAYVSVPANTGEVAPPPALR
jgi:hypothetical protein